MVKVIFEFFFKLSLAIALIMVICLPVAEIQLPILLVCSLFFTNYHSYFPFIKGTRKEFENYGKQD